MLVSCTREWDSGCVYFLLREGTVIEQTKSSVTQYASLPDIDSLSLEIGNSALSRIFSGKVSDWNPATKMTPGDYTVTVSAGDPYNEGPAAACFTGSADFSIVAGEMVCVTVNVTLGNSIVKIGRTGSFDNYFPESSFKVTTPLNPDGFVYDGSPVFISGSFSIVGTATNQSGNVFSLESKSWRGEPATCYNVIYDVTNAGGVTVRISFDDTVQTVDLGEINMN